MTGTLIAAGIIAWACIYLALTLVEYRDNEGGSPVRRALLATLIEGVAIALGLVVT